MAASLNLTKGGLEPATLTNLDTNEVINFMFNPFEYTLSKTNSWHDKPITGENVPYVTFQQGGAISMKLTLHFDSQLENKDVRTYTDKLWKLVMINEAKVNAKTGKGQPPAVAFEWGKMYFKSVITSMSQNYTLFSEKGIPLRCAVDVSLQQYIEDPNPSGQPQSSTGAPSTPTTAVQGQRLDNIASNPNDQRTIAENNNINNPLNVPRGTKLKVN